jgi:hypothetical protein
LQCLAVIRFREIQNDLNIVLERGDASSGDGVSQEVDLGDREHALLQVESQAVGGEDVEKHPEMFPVLLSGFAVHPVINKKRKT